MDVVDDIVRETFACISVAAEAADKIEIAIDYGADTYPDGTVWRFVKQLPLQPSSRKPLSHGYNYCALKAGGRWYLTGRRGNAPMTWNELVMFLVTGIPTSIHEVYQVTGWASVVPEPAEHGDDNE